MRYVPAHEVKENIGSYDIEDIYKAKKKLIKQIRRLGYLKVSASPRGWLDAFMFLKRHILNYNH
jgi:hypothetical protein